MLGFGNKAERNGNSGCKTTSRGKAILILAAALMLGYSSSAQAVLFGFHEIGDPSCNLPGLVVNITEEGTTPGGNVKVRFTFHLLEGTVTTRLDGVYFDDRCLNGQALMTFDSIIDADTGGDPGVDFESPANPGDPPNSNLTCPPFETTGEFSADSNNTAAAVGPGETLALDFTLNAGKSFQYLIDCLGEPDESVDPCIPGLRIGLSLQSSTCGSGAVSGTESIDITDCNSNFIPDECDIDGSGTDEDGRPCSLYGTGVGGSDDCNTNDIPDECENNICDDLNPCTTDSCENGACVNTPIPDCCQTADDCDDGLFCNGQETCVNGVCQPGTNPCLPGQFCNEATDTCDECQIDDHCDDGLFCNGEETCVNGVCQPGTPPCLPGQFCNEDTDTCDECQIDDHCDDGLFCNGEETCVNGVCQPGTNPCLPGQFCNEATDTCDECQIDDQCDDGLFCNGEETCVNGVCQPGIPSCLPGQTCIETTDTCGVCELDAECDDGLFCNGVETCVDGVCQPGTPPCLPGEFCNEATDTCDECQIAAHCNDDDPCTLDSCVAGTCSNVFQDADSDGVCDPNDQCPGFPDFLDCDDDGVPDGCETDCDDNGTPDECEFFCNAQLPRGDKECAPDCNSNGVPDSCEPDCDEDGTPDACETGFADCDGDGVQDDCEPDSDGDGVIDDCDICPGFDDNVDNNNDGSPDGCDEPPPPQPVPAGACCFPNESCASAADAAACSAAGGVFAGAGTDCSTTSCECGQPGGVSLLFSQLSFAPVCGGGCLMMIPVTILGFLTMRGRRRLRGRSRSRCR